MSGGFTQVLLYINYLNNNSVINQMFGIGPATVSQSAVLAFRLANTVDLKLVTGPIQNHLTNNTIVF